MPSWKKVITSGSNAHLNDLTLSGDISNTSGNFALDVDGDIELNADGSQITMKDGASTRFTFNLDSTPELDVAGAFTIDCNSDMSIDVAGGNLVLANNGTTRFDFGVDSTPEISTVGDLLIDPSTGNTSFDSHITASGNISSSGHFIGTHKGVGSGINNKVFFEGDGGPAKLASKDQSTTYLNFGQDSLGIVANNEDTFNVLSDGLVRVGTIGESHGTKALQVHGDISCSGNIHLEPGNLNQTVFVTTGSAGTDTIRFGIGTAKGEIPATALTVSGSISSSGFVSASSFSGDGAGLTNVSSTPPAGTISSSQHIFTAITSSGDISASGDLFVDDITADDITADKIIVDEIDATANGNLTIDVGEDSSVYITMDDGSTTPFEFKTAAGGSPTQELGITGNFLLDTSGDIELNADGGDISFKDASATLGGVNGSGIFSSNHITASGNISASGELQATELHLVKVGATSNEKLLTITEDGNERFSVDEDGDVAFDGDLTVGGSDIIIGATNADGFKITQGGAGNLFIHQGDDDSVGFFNIDGGDVELMTENFDNAVYVDNATSRVGIGTASPDEKLDVNGNLIASSSEFGGHITASGNISASGNFIGHFPDTNDDALHYPVVVDAQRGTLESQNALSINPSTNLTTVSSLKSTTHITASGDISSSGTIKATTFIAGDATGYHFKGDNVRIIADTDGDNVNFNGGGLNAEGNITASGNISSSGFVSASHFSGDGSGLSNVSATVGGNTFATDLKIGRDADNLIDFTTDNQITFRVSTGNNVVMKASGEIEATSLDISSDIDVDGTANLDAVDIDGNVDAAGSITMASNQFFYFDEDQTCAWRAFNTPANGRIMMNRIGGVGGLMSMSGSNSKAYVGINTGTAGGHANEGLTVNGMVSASGDIFAKGAFRTTNVNANGLYEASGRLIISCSDDLMPMIGDDCFFTNAGNSVFTIKGGEQRVGINDNVPASSLDVTGDINTTSHITASGNISSSGKLFAYGADFGDQSITNVNQIDLDGFRADGATNVQISLGTSGVDVVMEDGDSFTINSGEVNADFTYFDSGEASLIHGDAALSRVGISDTSPVSKLDVGGDLNVQSHITASGNISSSGNYIGNRQFDKTSNTDATHQGDIVYFGGTTSMDNGKIYHYKSDGTWELADADAVANCDGLLAVALGAASDTNGMLLRGTVTLDHDPGAVGDVLYLSTTAGQATATAPSGNTDIARVVGYCLDASNGQIWFNPSSTFVEVSA